MAVPDSEQSYDEDSVNLWVEPEREDRWQTYLDEESELQYSSQLVQRAIEREVQQDHYATARE